MLTQTICFYCNLCRFPSELRKVPQLGWFSVRWIKSFYKVFALRCGWIETFEKPEVYIILLAILHVYVYILLVRGDFERAIKHREHWWWTEATSVFWDTIGPDGRMRRRVWRFAHFCGLPHKPMEMETETLESGELCAQIITMFYNWILNVFEGCNLVFSNFYERIEIFFKFDLNRFSNVLSKYCTIKNSFNRLIE